MRFLFGFSLGVGDKYIFFNTPTPNEKPNESLVNNCATTDRSWKIPYIFDGQDLININFENADGFQILTNKYITIQPFMSDRVTFSFAWHINQMLIFEPNPDIESLGCDMAYQLPSFYQFEEVIVNNFQNTPKRRSGTAGLPAMYLKDINPPVKYKL